MTLNINTDRGSIKVTPFFPVSRSLVKRIESSLRNALEDRFRSADNLIEQLKKEDPLIGTPRGAILAYMTGQSMTQKKLSQKTGLAQGDISKMIHGKRPIGLIVAKKLGEAFGVDYRKFL